MIDSVNRILQATPYDFPVLERPYEAIACDAGVTEDEVLQTFAELRKQGLIRRIAAVLHHRKAAYKYNAMVVWKAGDGETERLGMLMASFPEVSHCYERDKAGYWDYNIFTMIHGKTMGDCMDAVERISQKTGITEFEILFSKREFKKTSLTIGNNE